MTILWEEAGKFNVLRGADMYALHASTIEPEDMPHFLISEIEDKKTDDIYFWEMSRYLIDILRVLYVGGYKPICGDFNVKDMHEKEFKYLITGDLLPYTITIKRHKRGHRIINADNICARKGETGILFGLLAYSGEKRKSVTISSIAKRVWTNYGTNDFYYLKRVLINAVEVELDNGETLDEYIRKAYRGGFLYDNADGLHVYNDIYVYDKNSLYPYIATTRPLPYGYPKYFEGGPSKSEMTDAREGRYYIFMRVCVNFDIKPDGIPCIRLAYDDEQKMTHTGDYLRTSRGGKDGKGCYIPLTLTLTYDDFMLLIDNYDILNIEYIDYVRFPTSTGLYDDYMKHFYEEKQKAGEAGDFSVREVNKMLLNSCIGATAKRIEYDNIMIDFSDDEEFIKFDDFISYGKQSQVYIGCAVNAMARRIIISSIKRDKEAWTYSDTDCKHLTRKIHGEKIGRDMGDYKLEEHFKVCIYYKRKTYIGIRDDGTAKVVIAGLQRKSTELIADLIKRRPKSYITREDYKPYELLQKMLMIFEAGIPFYDFEEYDEWGGPFRAYCVRTLMPLIEGMLWQDMSEEQEKLLKKVSEVWIKHGETTEDEIFDFIDADTMERKLWGDFYKIFRDAETEDEILVRLYTAKIPKITYESDGRFCKHKVVTWITLDKNYSFL